MDDERLRRGREIQRRLAPDFEAVIEAAVAGVAPDFARLTTEFAMGEVYARPGLDLRSRQIATISALAATGREPQLALHVRYGRNVGLTREEIGEILIQTAVYAGWPVALNAMRVAGEVFAAEDAAGA